MVKRRLRPKEVSLITWMIKNTDEGERILSELENLIVEEMTDGGMGSLRVVIFGEDKRVYSRELAKVDLFDVDQIPIFISINLDADGNFFELDVFKGDFSPLKKFPAIPQ
jgi:hypothetical protein